MKYSAIIVAAGKSSRFQKNKLMIKINGELVIKHSVNLFFYDNECEKIVLVTNLNDYAMYKKMFALFNKVLVVTIDSIHRNVSVKHGLSYCSKSEYVLIHDACRPYATEELIFNIKDNLTNYDAVIPYINEVDSLIELNDNIAHYIDRNKIKKIQTPQAFRTKVLIDSFEKNSSLDFNDEFSMALKYNPKITYKLILGETKNIKITYSEDIQ